jgi:hypothetical protein
LNVWKHTRPENGTRGVFGHSWSARGIGVIFIKHAVAGATAFAVMLLLSLNFWLSLSSEH